MSFNLISGLLKDVVPALAVTSSRFVTVPVPVQTGVIVGVTLASEQITEHTSEVCDVGLGLELQGSTVRQVLSKLRRASLAERRDRDRLLLFHNKLVFFGS